MCAKTLQLRGNKNSWPGRCVSEAINSGPARFCGLKKAAFLAAFCSAETTRWGLTDSSRELASVKGGMATPSGRAISTRSALAFALTKKCEPWKRNGRVRASPRRPDGRGFRGPREGEACDGVELLNRRRAKPLFLNLHRHTSCRTVLESILNLDHCCPLRN